MSNDAIRNAELKSIRELNRVAIQEISELQDTLAEAEARNEKLYAQCELLEAIIIKVVSEASEQISVPIWMLSDE